MQKVDRRFVLSGLLVLAGAGRRAEPLTGAAAAETAAPEPRPDLYACEGCEAALERDPLSLSSSAVLAGPDEPGEAMRVEGIVFAADGTTPAADIVIYAHHTNADGLYANGNDEFSQWSRRNGRLRGWVRTGADGRYAFDTIKPAPYPDGSMPAHVHLYVLEPGKPPYWIDDVVFEGEFGVTQAYRESCGNRGGNGIVALERRSDGWLAQRDIVLERHPA